MNQPQTPSNSAFSRRSFLQTTSTLLGGAALGGLSLERSAHAAGSDTLKLALIGCGGRGSGAADQALSTKFNIKLIAMADAFSNNLDNALSGLKKHGDKVAVSDDNKFIGFDAYKNAIALADVVILATPPGFRPIHFEEAVRQGKHIFMEKPVAIDAPGVRRVLASAEAAKAKNLKIAVGLQRRHQPPYLEMMKRIHDGAIGDVVAMRCYWNGATPWVRSREDLQRQAGRELTEMEYQMRNWYYFNWLCGDHINEQHIHNLDVINWAKNGYPVRANGMGGVQVRKGKDYGEIFDHHTVEFEYADGSRCASQCRHQVNTWNSVSEALVGTKGTCRSQDHSEYAITGPNAWRMRGNEETVNAYQQEHDDFWAAVVSNTPYSEAERGAKSTMTAIMGRMATYSGKIVTWDEAINSKIDLMPKSYTWDSKPPVLPGPDGMYPCAIPGKTVTV